MKRIIWMLLMNLLILPPAILKLLRLAAHPEKHSREERYQFLRYVDERAVKGGRVEVEGHGMELLPGEDGFLMCPNHQGMFDVLAIIHLFDRPISPVFKKELDNIPLLKQIIICLDALSIDRSDVRQGMKVILKMTEELGKGHNYLIFPEGTRSRSGNQVMDFKGGSFKCAVKSRCPIVPVALIDSYKAFDTGSIAKVKVQVHFLEPLYYEEYKDMKTTEIAEIVKKRIEARIAEVCAEDSGNP